MFYFQSTLPFLLGLLCLLFLTVVSFVGRGDLTGRNSLNSLSQSFHEKIEVESGVEVILSIGEPQFFYSPKPIYLFGYPLDFGRC